MSATTMTWIRHAAVRMALCAVAASAPIAARSETKAPIKVGAISSIQLFPEATAAVKAYFDVVNAAGGINGRPLQLIVQDDQADPALARAAAKRLLDVEQVVAHVGSASALECEINAATYEKEGLVSIQGTGVDPACFESANISPVNAGPYLSTGLALEFLSTVRRCERLCVYTTNYAPVQAAAFTREVDHWRARSGRTVLRQVVGMPLDQKLVEKVRDAAEAGCQGVVYTGIEPHVVEWMTAVASLKVTGIDWVFLTPAYTGSIVERLGPAGKGMFAMSEFEPWSSRSGMLNDWRDVMARGGVPRTSLSQGGYVAALLFVRTLRTIKGEVSRASVTRAFKEMSPQKVPMLGTQYEFGSGKAHASNRANVPVQLQQGRWAVAHWDYIVVPAAGQ